jgi:aspartate-semialdehyde dehydrogenase
MNRNPHVAVVGATGAVGIEMIKTLEKRNFPVGKLTLLASARSAGKKLKFRGQEIAFKEPTCSVDRKRQGCYAADQLIKTGHMISTS